MSRLQFVSGELQLYKRTPAKNTNREMLKRYCQETGVPMPAEGSLMTEHFVTWRNEYLRRGTDTIPTNPYLSEETFQHLMQIANDAATITPSQVPQPARNPPPAVDPGPAAEERMRALWEQYQSVQQYQQRMGSATSATESAMYQQQMNRVRNEQMELQQRQAQQQMYQDFGRANATAFTTGTTFVSNESVTPVLHSWSMDPLGTRQDTQEPNLSKHSSKYSAKRKPKGTMRRVEKVWKEIIKYVANRFCK